MFDTQALSLLVEDAVAKVMEKYAKPNREYMTINEVCEALHMSRWTVDKHLRLNNLPHIKIDGRVLIERSALYEWLDQHEK
ncbi:helix-turn-helix domain-containing protein [Exiguobacterium sp. s5]|uniref:helix-turn-helix domain-containing protein n=1 Tax=Exiguobacterium sp. s5 TaxID=2751239 RepID=UPI001BE5A7FE|nr:helix-turn-helix domain-containing protein [Exiguobacterium sp. s5]